MMIAVEVSIDAGFGTNNEGVIFYWWFLVWDFVGFVWRTLNQSDLQEELCGAFELAQKNNKLTVGSSIEVGKQK